MSVIPFYELFSSHDDDIKRAIVSSFVPSYVWIMDEKRLSEFKRFFKKYLARVFFKNLTQRDYYVLSNEYVENTSFRIVLTLPIMQEIVGIENRRLNLGFDRGHRCFVRKDSVVLQTFNRERETYDAEVTFDLKTKKAKYYDCYSKKLVNHVVLSYLRWEYFDKWYQTLCRHNSVLWESWPGDYFTTNRLDSFYVVSLNDIKEKVLWSGSELYD